ncbi:hypothetical protein CHLNCDRAFT_55230 [Chlorella variabilis]|uniref:Chalcone isomerase domain-containing protein n=1 Tax=Chlorella variabilis TaxID=554065 RepID=E1ZSA8_CHLVA|nr:hypothetical protein CHLNCDRAFT_55230 [Chlorella variabilis]EFN51273.1 hypothetical protein CHLNCDRAFT_55230 [Chlorella variabilis]|eukprot:XP_005843375.1 hypothetical protein CHLNCDRAFT_55230 [Chlorella variabilis]
MFASIGAGLLGSPAAPPPVQEKRTGTVFPGELEYCAGRRGCPAIAGAGARTKRIAGVKNLDIYALGLFVDPSAVRGALQGKFRGADPASLAKDQKLFDGSDCTRLSAAELVSHEGIEKTLRIVITSGMVKQRPFLEALEERLEPPLKQAGELEALQRFKRQFDGAPFRRGLQITFCASGTKLTTTIDGKQVGTIASRQLTRALLDIYLGTNPASKGAKDSFGRGLASMVLD